MYAVFSQLLNVSKQETLYAETLHKTECLIRRGGFWSHIFFYKCEQQLLFEVVFRKGWNFYKTFHNPEFLSSSIRADLICRAFQTPRKAREIRKNVRYTELREIHTQDLHSVWFVVKKKKIGNVEIMSWRHTGLGSTHFLKIWKPHENCRRQKGNMKQIPYSRFSGDASSLNFQLLIKYIYSFLV